ncbi:hypothetical protein CPLU01_00739 [Colletotrichum plurivorum]|uniref:Uncharacterized protein n=1 Tax=Colletotrichum plurivorum TaxID=2175906 RepID=A0A8H6NRG3_9PEZI|nr:hypothetical protein CPLU01_00739 [Colletotrichum plurivorum]
MNRFPAIANQCSTIDDSWGWGWRSGCGLLMAWRLAWRGKSSGTKTEVTSPVSGTQTSTVADLRYVSETQHCPVIVTARVARSSESQAAPQVCKFDREVRVAEMLFEQDAEDHEAGQPERTKPNRYLFSLYPITLPSEALRLLGGGGLSSMPASSGVTPPARGSLGSDQWAFPRPLVRGPSKTFEKVSGPAPSDTYHRLQRTFGNIGKREADGGVGMKQRPQNMAEPATVGLHARVLTNLTSRSSPPARPIDDDTDGNVGAVDTRVAKPKGLPLVPPVLQPVRPARDEGLEMTDSYDVLFLETDKKPIDNRGDDKTAIFSVEVSERTSMIPLPAARLN